MLTRRLRRRRGAAPDLHPAADPALDPAVVAAASGHVSKRQQTDAVNRRGQWGQGVRGGQRGARHRKRSKPERLGSVQQLYVAVEDAIGGVLVLNMPHSGRAGGSARAFRAILDVTSLNYALKTEGEQEAILAGYRAFLNGLTFPVQILIRVRPLDLRPYLARLHEARDRESAMQPAQPAPASLLVGTPAETGTRRDTVEAVWVRLAEDEERYVLELAAHRTLLERHYYLVIPAEDGAGTTGSNGHAAHVESSLSEGAGLHLPVDMPAKASALPSWLPLPGRQRRREEAYARELVRAEKQLTLRTHAVTRELERLGLEARRLADEELVAVYHRSIAPDAATRFPIPTDVLAAAGRPIAKGEQYSVRAGTDAVSIPSTEDQCGEVGGHAGETDGPSLSEEPDEMGRRGACEGTLAAFGDLADVLAPASVSLTRDDVRLDDTYCRTLAVVGYPRHVYAGWLERLIDLDEPLDVVLHIHPQSTAAMIRQLSHRLVQLHSSRLLNEERGRVGHPELGVAYRDVEQMRERLQRGDECVFATSLYVHVRAPALPAPDTGLRPARRALDDRVARIETELANQQLVARPATFEQDLALLSCLPEGRDRLLRTRLLDTSSLATAFPFLSNSLSMPGGILLGTTANGSPVFIDAFAPELENANKVVFAKSGAGKSYACKIEALRSLLRGTDVYVVDPEAEYEPLATAVGGRTVRLAAGAQQHLNPFDLPTASEHEVAREVSVGDVLADKVQSLHALLDLMLADRGPTGTAGLSQREKGLLDRALYEVYRRAGITSDPETHLRPAPLLRDLYEVLVGGGCGTDDSHLAERLHRYVHGSLSRLFAEPTNVELSNRLVVFDVRDMDAELRPLGLYLIAEFVWTRIRRERRPRLLVIDEAWTLMQYQEGGRFLAGLARRARKYYLGLVTITQDAEDFLSSEHGRTVLANSSVQLLMKQDSSTIEAVTKAFRLSTGERQYLLGCHKGEGLLFARGGHVALQIGASPFEHELATTDPRELAARQQRVRAVSPTPTTQEDRGKDASKGRLLAMDAERPASTRARHRTKSASGQRPRERLDAQTTHSDSATSGAPGVAASDTGLLRSSEDGAGKNEIQARAEATVATSAVAASAVAHRSAEDGLLPEGGR